jgi:hypothetical protein
MKRSTVRATALTVAALAAVVVTTTAQAQICAGFPAPERGFYFGGRIDFPPSPWNSLGVEAAYNAAGPLSVFGGLNVLTVTDVEGSTNEFRVGAAFELPALGAAIGPNVSTCPVAEVRWISEDGDTYMEIPIGLGIGVNLGAPAGPAIMAYGRPELVIARLSGPDFDTVSQTDFGLTAGAMVGFGMFNVGGEVRHVFRTGDDPIFGIRVGIGI